MIEEEIRKAAKGEMAEIINEFNCTHTDWVSVHSGLDKEITFLDTIANGALERLGCIQMLE